MKSKKAVIGGIVTTFVSTIIIVIILLVFTLASSTIKTLTKTESNIANPYVPASTIANLNSVHKNTENLFYIKNLLNCETTYNNKKIKIQDVLNLKINNKELIQIIQSSNCIKYYTEFYTQNTPALSFWCEPTQCSEKPRQINFLFDAPYSFFEFPLTNNLKIKADIYILEAEKLQKEVKNRQ